MKEVIISDKQEYLNQHYPFTDIPNMADKKRCLHCYKIFTVKDYKVYKGENGFEYICCPHSPDCNGTIIDWMPPNWR